MVLRNTKSGRHAARAAGILLALLLSPLAAVAQDDVPLEEILPPEAAPEADVSTLAAETELLDSIGDGVALSLAYCQLDEACEPAVSREELSQLVQTVDQRITALAERYSESSEPGLEEVLVAYAEVREKYNRHLEQLEEVTGAETAPAATEDAFADDVPAAPAAPPAAAAPEVYDIFEDVDEDLTDEPAP